MHPGRVEPAIRAVRNGSSSSISAYSPTTSSRASKPNPVSGQDEQLRGRIQRGYPEEGISRGSRSRSKPTISPALCRSTSCAVARH